MNAFLPADILFPKVDSMEKWAVIACDQFTSDPAYWERVRNQSDPPGGRARHAAGGRTHGADQPDHEGISGAGRF